MNSVSFVCLFLAGLLLAGLIPAARPLFATRSLPGEAALRTALGLIGAHSRRGGVISANTRSAEPLGPYDPGQWRGESKPAPRNDGGPAADREAEADRGAFGAFAAPPQRDNDSATGDRAAPETDGRPSHVIVFAHVTGGAGATTLAVNTAYALNEAQGRRGCCVIDLDLQFGGVASHLDLPYSSAIRALIDDPRRLERVVFDQMLVRHSSGLQVITAPRLPVPLDALKPSTVSDLLHAARSRFPLVVVDLPVALVSWTDIVLRMATHIHLVTPMNVPAAHRVVRLLYLLQQHDLKQLPIRVVVNRDVGSSRGGTIAPGQFKTAIDRAVDHVVPEDFALVQQSQNQGTPAVRLAPKSKFAQAIGKIVAEDLGEAAQAGPRRRLSLFDRS